MKNYFWMRWVLLPVSLVFASCTHFGAHNMPPDRISYNKSIVNSELQQILLNLVRLRFGDAPQFVSLNNIVSQFSFQGGIAADFSRSMSPGMLSTTVDIAPSVTYSESPTITYTPMQGEEFVTRLLTPVDLQVLKMFHRDGWGVGRILRIFIQRLGPLDNAVVASRPTSSRLPVYKDFNTFTELMRELQWDHGYVALNDSTDGSYRIHIIFTRYDELKPAQKAVLKKLNVTRENPDFWFTSKDNSEPRNFYAETRTMLSIFNYLSKGVEVPPDQMAYTGEPHFKDGSYFNWQDVIGGLMDIKYSKVLPKEAYIYVHYRGYYFYVDDKDTNTKETFTQLSMLNGIFQGNIQSVLPVFTVS